MPTSSESIAFRGAPQEREWYAGARLIRSVTNQADPRNLAVVWVLAALVGLALAASSESRGLGVAIVVISAFLWWWTRTVDSRNWRRNPGLREKRWGTLSSEALEISVAGSQNSISWQRAIRCASGDEALIVETAANHFVLLTRSMFADEDSWSSARELVSASLPKASKIWTNLPPGTSRVGYFLKRVFLMGLIVLALLLWEWLRR